MPVRAEKSLVKAEKFRFVQRHLVPMLVEATGDWIRRARYQTDGCLEWVQFETASGAFRANVTGSSLFAIVEDVMRVVNERF